jgi:hypothetical protein
LQLLDNVRPKTTGRLPVILDALVDDEWMPQLRHWHDTSYSNATRNIKWVEVFLGAAPPNPRFLFTNHVGLLYLRPEPYRLQDFVSIHQSQTPGVNTGVKGKSQEGAAQADALHQQNAIGTVQP